jgi:uncharacterized protein YggU (UPF0235/DUF167 family)
VTARGRATLEVRVMPRASRTSLARDAGGALRAYLTAPPVEGAANRALVELLAGALRLPKRCLTIVRGVRGRDKVVSVEGCTEADLERRVAGALGSPVDKAGDGG